MKEAVTWEGNRFELATSLTGWNALEKNISRHFLKYLGSVVSKSYYEADTNIKTQGIDGFFTKTNRDNALHKTQKNSKCILITITQILYVSTYGNTKYVLDSDVTYKSSKENQSKTYNTNQFLPLLLKWDWKCRTVLFTKYTNTDFIERLKYLFKTEWTIYLKKYHPTHNHLLLETLSKAYSVCMKPTIVLRLKASGRLTGHCACRFTC